MPWPNLATTETNPEAMDAKIERVQSAPGMQRFAYVLAGFYALGCQRGAGGTPPAVSEQYRADIANLCDVVARSGADQLPAGERAPTIATWLGSHLTTEDAHAYL